MFEADKDKGLLQSLIWDQFRKVGTPGNVGGYRGDAGRAFDVPGRQYPSWLPYVNAATTLAGLGLEGYGYFKEKDALEEAARAKQAEEFAASLQDKDSGLVNALDYMEYLRNKKKPDPYSSEFYDLSDYEKLPKMQMGGSVNRYMPQTQQPMSAPGVQGQSPFAQVTGALTSAANLSANMNPGTMGWEQFAERGQPMDTAAARESFQKQAGSGWLDAIGQQAKSYTGMAEGGYVDAPGEGHEDNIAIRVSPKEYVIDADTVTNLGQGDPDMGAYILDLLRASVRQAKAIDDANASGPLQKFLSLPKAACGGAVKDLPGMQFGGQVNPFMLQGTGPQSVPRGMPIGGPQRSLGYTPPSASGTVLPGSAGRSPVLGALSGASTGAVAGKTLGTAGAALGSMLGGAGGSASGMAAGALGSSLGSGAGSALGAAVTPALASLGSGAAGAGLGAAGAGLGAGAAGTGAGLAGGAAAGAAAGSVVPVVGTIIGALAGALLGAGASYMG